MPIQTPYQPLTGRFTKLHLRRAKREYERRLDQGNGDIRVVLLSQTSMEFWHTVKISYYDDESLSVEARFFSNELINFYIAKAHNHLHWHPRMEISKQLQEYCSGNQLRVFTGSNQVYQSPRTGQYVLRRSELEIRPHFIANVEANPVPVANGLAWLREYFELQSKLRVAVHVQIFEREEARDNGFPALAVVLRRDEQDAVVVDDAVSFGSARLSCRTIEALKSYSIRELPLVLQGENPVNPWSGHHARLTISKADFFKREKSTKTK
ncbi:hypothetical protein Poli38472_010621 [Pythium oligandrum]|uniref:Uncharacterized protein n=1 Tax=Pythium oligandrum TaxID=41045 RepID=A0A8K1FCE2_PYTOL|nr:hypothetical protein Poli38472_010621 [Pythium oligandrum]|eukprot:TMW55739.1 hypothetical protein Poli38472_010621 [Pythium oligandrum]